MRDRYYRILCALVARGPMTPDEFVADRGLYINSWAPSFTTLRQGGMVRRTGERRATRHGAEAYVVEITDQGRAWLNGVRTGV